MSRPLAEIIAHIRAVCDAPSVEATLIQTEDLYALCDAAEIDAEQLRETCIKQGETIDRLHEEIERLTDALKTCRDLRVYESREIVRLRKLYE